MKFELDTFNRNISDNDLIDDLKHVAILLKKDKVTLDEYNEYGKFHSTTLTRRFGSWFKCLELAGLKNSRSIINIPNEDLFENLMNIWTQLGRQPRYKEVNKPFSKFSAGTYENRFGSWRKALESFVQYMNIGEISLPINLTQQKKTNGHKTQRTINLRMRFLVFQRDNFKCSICGKSPATDPKIVLHVDHIKPWAKRGETVLNNLQTLCSECNIGKSDLNMRKGN